MLLRAMLVVGTIAALSPALDQTGAPAKEQPQGFDRAAIEEMARGTAAAVTEKVTQAVVTEAVRRIAASDRDSLTQLATAALKPAETPRDRPAQPRP